MIKGDNQVSRKTVNEDRIAICPHFGCKHLEKVKPLKFGFLGFRKYPKCSKHKIPLIFINEFIGDFLHAVIACLFDLSSVPPKNLRSVIKKKIPNEQKSFINGWMFCNPIGRGAQIVSQYMDGLSRGYMRLLSWKQRKALKNEKSSKKRYNMLRVGLKKIADEYTTFLQEFHEKSELLYDPENLHPLSKDIQRLLKIWLKEHLTKIRSTKTTELRKSPIYNESLSMLKEEYDKILHAGTCALLLSKSLSIVTKTISPFELFSAYHEFLEASLCREIKRKDVEILIEDSQELIKFNGENKLTSQEDEKKHIFNKSESMKKRYINFKNEVRNRLKTLISSINSTQKQKDIIWTKSLEILDKFISRAENNEFTIRKDTRSSTVASTIIYTIIISNRNMPEINLSEVSKLSNVNVGTINSFYNNHFRYLYPKIEFQLEFSKKLRKIKDVFALYFFELMKNLTNDSINDIEIRISEYVSTLRKNILRENNLPKPLPKGSIEILRELVDFYPDIFEKYFSDLAKIVNYLMIQSTILKKIDAHFIIQPICDFLIRENINLLYKPTTLRRYIILEIYDFLREMYPKYFPPRVFQRDDLSKKEIKVIRKNYRNTIGNKIKLYVIEHIYNGLYFKHGKGKCPKCREAGFKINTDISRLSSLEFHHKSKVKERSFTAPKLGRIFENSGFNPNFLEDLIKIIESEKVILLCRNHHKIIHHKYFRYFIHLINWEDIFTLPSDLIHILAKVSVENFKKTRNLSRDSSYYARYTIIRYLKKRYIFENFYGEFCPTCRESNIKGYLPSFDYHHIDGPRFDHNPYVKTLVKSASELFIQSYSCSEIAKILDYEKGGFVCANCHNVLGYSSDHLKLLNKTYKDMNLAEKILDDYNSVKKKFRIFYNVPSIKDPLETNNQITDSYSKYLNAVYKMTQEGTNITHSSLSHYLKLSRATVSEFLNKNKYFFQNFVVLTIGSNRLKKYILTDQGKKYIELIYYFKNYYKNLRDIY